MKTMLRTGLMLAMLATTTFAASQKMTCRITGKTMEQCCCEMKSGMLFLTTR